MIATTVILVAVKSVPPHQVIKLLISEVLHLLLALPYGNRYWKIIEF
jgi:hypothetical protein